MTLEDFWNINIGAKWAPVIIEGKKIKDRFLREEMFARLDNSTDPYMFNCNNRNEFGASVQKVMDLEDSMTFVQAKDICKNLEQKGIKLDPNDLFSASLGEFHKYVDSWSKWWGVTTFSGDGSVFDTDVNNGISFFNPRTGVMKPTARYIGKYIGCAKELKEEIEWFAKEFPTVDLFLTLADEGSENYEDYEFKGTLHIYNGKIEVVKTREYNINKLPKFSGNKARTMWKNFLFKFVRFAHNIQKIFDEEGYIYWHNYRLLNQDYSNYRFYSNEEIMRKIHYWEDVCYENNGNFYQFIDKEMGRKDD